jgi:hypothetical protein
MIRSLTPQRATGNALAAGFNLTVTKRLMENKTVIREKKWNKLIPRNYQ